jgi:hypothetical protein
MSSRPIGGLKVMESPEGEGTMTRATGYAPVNGLNMYYEAHGTGRPLMLMHGRARSKHRRWSWWETTISYGWSRPPRCAT